MFVSAWKIWGGGFICNATDAPGIITQLLGILLTHKHTHAHRHTQTDRHTHTHTDRHTHTHRHTHTNTQTHTHTHTHTQTDRHTHTHRHTHTNTQTHTNRHVYTLHTCNTQKNCAFHHDAGFSICLTWLKDHGFLLFLKLRCLSPRKTQ